MKLRFIKTNKCPICGCDTVVMEYVESDFDHTKVREHCDGGQWEHRAFLCGYQVAYVPNFCSEQKDRDCRHDPRLIEQREKQRKTIDAVKDLIKRADCDPDFKARIMDALPTCF